MSSEGEKVIELEKLISEDKEIAEVLNRFLINIVSNLKISMETDFDINFLKTEDPVLSVIGKYRNHPSGIIIIKNKTE